MLFTVMTTILIINCQAEYFPGGVPKTDQKSLITNAILQGTGQPTSYDSCAFSDNKLPRKIEGVRFKPVNDSIDDSLSRQKEITECHEKRKAAAARLQEAYSKARKEATLETAKVANQPSQSECTSKMDKKQKSCYLQKFIEGLQKTPVWKVIMYGNVAQLWFEKHLIRVMVREDLNYNIEEEPQKCVTFFDEANLIVEENALGHLIKVTGRPTVPAKVPKKECVPCNATDTQKRVKNVEGQIQECSASCGKPNVDQITSAFSYQ